MGEEVIGVQETKIGVAASALHVHASVWVISDDIDYTEPICFFSATDNSPHISSFNEDERICTETHPSPQHQQKYPFMSSNAISPRVLFLKYHELQCRHFWTSMASTVANTVRFTLFKIDGVELL